MEALERRVMLSVTPLAGTPFGTSGSYGNSGNTYAKAMDGNLSTYFDAPSANGNYLGLDLGTAQAVGSVRFAPRENFAGRMVGGKIQGSNTSSTSGYTDLYTIGSTPPVGSITIADISDTTAYRWVRYLSPNGGYGNVAEIEFEAPATADNLPSGWTQGEVGSPTLPGSANYDSSTDTWTVTGGGWDIFDDGAEQYHFVHTDLTGDGTVSAEVTAVQNTSNWAKGGLALRDGTATGAAYAAVVVTPAAGAMFGWRNTANGSVTWVTVAGVAPPQYLKLGRVGQSVSAYYSANGTNWAQIGSTQSIALGITAQAGLAVAAHTNSQDNTSTFTAVGLTVAATVPDAPANLSASAGDGQVSLTWDAADEADTYNIYRGTATGGEGSTPIQTGVTGTSFSDTTVTNGTEYFYKVSAVNEVGESARSNEDSATPQLAAPAAPSNLSASAGDAQATLTWDAVMGADSYNLYAALASGDEGTAPVATGLSSPAYTDASLPNGTTIYYQVTAVNAAGESLPSAEASATPQYRLTISGDGSVAAGALYTLNLTSAVPTGTFSEIQIDWGDGSAVQSVAAGTPSAAHTFTPGIDGAVIFASGIITGQDAAWSNPELVNITGVTAPAAPTNLTASSSAIRQMDVSWSAGSNDALGYTVQRSDDAGQTWNDVGTVYGQTSFSDTGLDTATAYSYRVIGANDGGSSSPSAVITAATPDEDLHFSYYIDENDQVVLTWTDPTLIGPAQQGMAFAPAAVASFAAAASTPSIYVTGYELEEKNLDPSVNENFHFLNTLSTPYLIYAPSVGPNDHITFRMRADYNDGTVGDYHTLNVSPSETPPSDPNDPTPTLSAPSNVQIVGDDAPTILFDSGYGTGHDFSPYSIEGRFKADGDPYRVIAGTAGGEPVWDDGHDQWLILPVTSDKWGITYSGSIRVVNSNTGEISPWSNPVSFTYEGTRPKAPQINAEPVDGGQVRITVSMDQAMVVRLFLAPSGQPQAGAATLVYGGLLDSGQSVVLNAGPTGSHFFAVGSLPVTVSPYSNFVDATGNTAVTKPAAPDAAWASVKTTHDQVKVTVAWHNTPDNEDKFIIERAKSGTTSWQQVGATGADETTYTDTISVTQADWPYKYDYRISAKNSADTSDPSPVATVAPNYGGPDVTSQLTVLATQVQQNFFHLSYFEKIGLEVETIVPPMAIWGWDIDGFPNRGFGFPQGTGQKGMGTVTVNDKVFDQQAVNYFLSGLVVRQLITFNPLAASVFMAEAVGHIYTQFDVNNEKMSWFQAGIRADPFSPMPPANLQDLLPGRANETDMHWHGRLLSGTVPH